MSQYPDWPPNCSDVQSQELIHHAVDYALSHSLIMRPYDQSLAGGIHAPLSLLPTPFPRKLFNKANELQKAYNDLYANLACDKTFLNQVIGGAVSRVDEFQGGLWKIWQRVNASGLVQPLQLGLFRSDYLVHAVEDDELQLKQVEFNTISSSFGPLAAQVSSMHRHLSKASLFPSHTLLSIDNLPENSALSQLVEGLYAGWKAYGSQSAAILFVVQEPERNAFDQRQLEWALTDNYGIRIVRQTFQQLEFSCQIGAEQVLRIKTETAPHEIAVVYFRAGYTPNDYPSQAQWDTRYDIERSKAIKCPSIALQLAGAKKVQQVLAQPNIVEQHLSSAFTSSATQLRETFMGMWPLDASAIGQEGLRLANSQSERFVLKPQREGGGNNIYRGKIVDALAVMAARDASKAADEPREHESYILMELIQPPRKLENVMVRAGTAQGNRAEVISELGCFGYALFREDANGRADFLANSAGGHLLRTKGSTDDEGGVAVGFSVIDSPLLFD